MKISTSRCGPVKGSLSSADRKALPAQCFALSGRRYPLYVVNRGEAVPDAEHAANAKARAAQAHARGSLSRAELERVDKAANRVIALCKSLRVGKPKGSSCGCSHGAVTHSVKIYCSNGQIHVHKTASMGEAQRIAREERSAHPHACTVVIEDAAGKVLRRWQEDGKL